MLKMCWKFQGILRIMSKISRHIENCVENFKVCWKPCQNHNDVTMTWPFQYILYKTKRVKIKTEIIIESNMFIWCYICSLVEMLCVLEEKTGLVCRQLLHHLYGMDIFLFNLAVNFLHFLSNSVNLESRS